MSAAIVGIGLVSPAGRMPREHAFFLRVDVPEPLPSPFVGPEDEMIRCRHAGLLGAAMPLGERLAKLSEGAFAEALAPLLARRRDVRVALWICTEGNRPGLVAAHRGAVERALAARVKPTATARVTGAAGFFAALAAADAALAAGEVDAAAVVAVDSHVDVATLTAILEHPPSPWAKPRIAPSEGAAAVVLMTPGAARAAQIDAIGTLHAAAVRTGAACDDNDEIVDGVAMTEALAAVLPADRLRLAFGQETVDELRRRDWHFATARNAERLHPECDFLCLEEHLGNLGAAAGAMNLVYGVAALRHGTLRRPTRASEPFVAWAVSRDGARGAALVSAVEP